MVFVTYTSILIIAFRSCIAFLGITPNNHLKKVKKEKGVSLGKRGHPCEG